MHWGLTTFERKRIERIALDHPFFDMHDPLLTKKELRAIIAQGPSKTGPQVIAEAKRELGLEHIPAIQQKRSFPDALCDVSFVPFFRRTLALSMLCLLLAFFMIFSVPGRALAEEVYAILVDFVDGILGIRNNTPIQNHEVPDFTLIPEDIKTPQEISKYIDCPIFVLGDKLTHFEYETDSPEMLSLISQYENQRGQSSTISQEIYGPNISWGIGVDAQKDSIEIETPSGIHFLLNQSNDETLYAIAFTEVYSLRVFSREYSQAEFISMLQDINETE